MTGAPVDYDAVLADLEDRKAKLEAAIAVIKALRGGTLNEESAGSEAGSASQPTPSPRATAGTTALQNDRFFGLSTADAIKQFLGMSKRPQTARAIADALRDGGQVHAVDEKVAYVNVATALRRLAARDEVVQTRNRDWGLAEWYGNRAKGESD